MATSDFDTSKMQKLYPGLNVQPGVVDKSGAIDDSLLTTFAGGFTLGRDAYKTIETNKALDEANKLAYDSYNEYATSSASGRTSLLAEQDELQKMLPGTEGQARNNILNRIDEITSNLAKGESQGMMSPYEHAIRSKAKLQKQVQDTPWLQDEIVARYAKTTNQLGLEDLYSQDLKAAEYKRKIDFESYKQKVEFIQPFVDYNAYSLPEDQLDIVYNAYKAKNARYQRGKFILENNEGLTKLQAYQVWKDTGGTANIKEQVNTEIYQGLRAILIDNTRYPDFTAKQTAARELVNGYETAYLALLEDLPMDKEDVKNFKGAMEATFTIIRQDMESDLSLAGLEKYKKNIAGITKADLDTRFMVQFGTTQQMQETVNGLLDTLSKIKNAGGLNTELESQIMNELNVYLKAMSNPKNTSYSATEIDVVNDPTWGMVVEQGTRNLTTTSQPGNINLTTATLNNINNQDFNDKSASNLKGYDLQLTALSQLKPEVFNHIYQNQDFRSSIVSSMGRYKEYTMAVFQRESTNVDYDIKLDKATGRLISTDPLPPAMEANLQRANVYIKLRAMMEGTDPVKIAERILKDELNNLEPRTNGN